MALDLFQSKRLFGIPTGVSQVPGPHENRFLSREPNRRAPDPPTPGTLGNPATAAPQKDRFFPPAGTDGGGLLALGRRPGFTRMTIRTRSIRIELYSPSGSVLAAAHPSRLAAFFAVAPGRPLGEDLSLHTLMEPS